MNSGRELSNFSSQTHFQFPPDFRSAKHQIFAKNENPAALRLTTTDCPWDAMLYTKLFCGLLLQSPKPKAC